MKYNWRVVTLGGYPAEMGGTRYYEIDNPTHGEPALATTLNADERQEMLNDYLNKKSAEAMITKLFEVSNEITTLAEVKDERQDESK